MKMDKSIEQEIEKYDSEMNKLRDEFQALPDLPLTLTRDSEGRLFNANPRSVQLDPYYNQRLDVNRRTTAVQDAYRKRILPKARKLWNDKLVTFEKQRELYETRRANE